MAGGLLLAVVGLAGLLAGLGLLPVGLLPVGGALGKLMDTVLH